MGKGDGGRISRLKKASSKSFSYLMVLPAVLLFTLFAVYPFVEGIKLGFYRWDGLSPMTFIGMENYVNILHDEQYWSALKNTFLYAVVTTIAKNLLGLVLAMVMMKITHGKGFFRTITYMPVTFSYVVCGILWLWIFNPDMGILNNFLTAIGFLNPPMWLSDPEWSKPAPIIMRVWQMGGYYMLLFLAGLQTIPETLYEAAEVDGASSWQRFTRITVPMLSNTTFVVVILLIIESFNMFESIFVMTEGGPLGSTSTIMYYIYEQGFMSYNMGYASALAWIFFALILVFTLIQFRFRREQGGE